MAYLSHRGEQCGDRCAIPRKQLSERQAGVLAAAPTEDHSLRHSILTSLTSG